MARVVIEVSGGIVQNVRADIDTEVIIVDYDNDGTTFDGATCSVERSVTRACSESEADAFHRLWEGR